MTQLTQATPTPQALANPLTEGAQRVRKYLQAGKAANTRRAYASGVTGQPSARAEKMRKFPTFAAFCDERGYTTLPADPATVADYLTHLADMGATVATIEQRRAAIANAHKAQASNPCSSELVKETMKGIRRERGIMAKPKAALSRDELRAVVAALPDTLRGKRDRALLLMGWAGAFRRSELVALTVADVDIKRDRLTVTIQRSKTDQEGQGLYKTLPTLPNDPALCPSKAYTAWINAAGINSGPIFRSIDRWGHVSTGTEPMQGNEVARIIKAACKVANIDPRKFAGHSLRSGFVTEATNAGANDGDIMEQTGHKSSATLRRYKQLAGRGAVRATLAAFGETK